MPAWARVAALAFVVAALVAVWALLDRQWQDLAQLRSEIDAYPWRVS